MIKPNMPNMPGIGNVTDTLEFMKNLWGGMGVPGMTMPGMNLPGMVMPTLSVEEINKRITDLKTVESWLALNMNMLRTTIQALEVQAATIAALQSMGDSFSAGLGAVAKVAGDSAAAMGAGNGGTSGGNGHGARDSLQEQERASAASATPQPAGRDEVHAASLTAPLVNAAAWWNALQDQFKQAVSSAISPETEAPESEEAKPKPAAKPRAKSASSSAPSSAMTTSRKRKPSK